MLGKGGVQGLDDEAHRHRKQMFMSLMRPERIAQLVETVADGGIVFAGKWAAMEHDVVLYDELQELLTRAACSWAGVPLVEKVKERTRQITSLFDAAGSVVPRHWFARFARRSADRWFENFVTDVRAVRIRPPQHSAAQIIAHHRELSGDLLNTRIAAVELLNVIRPIVATSVYITFVTHALHEYPAMRHKLDDHEEEGYAECFVQEVWRFYPFFPVPGARLRNAFEWNKSW